MCAAAEMEQDPEPVQDLSSQTEQDLQLCKQFLAESQDDVCRLQAEGCSQARTISQLQQELHSSREQNKRLQQHLAADVQAAEAKLAAANAQLATTKQQLLDAKQALVAMQKAMRELQAQQQQQGDQWVAHAEEAAGKLAAVKATHTAGQ